MKLDGRLLSAFIDGELAEQDVKRLKGVLYTDAVLRQELSCLVAADAAAREEFDLLLNEPIPSSIVERIKRTNVQRK